MAKKEKEATPRTMSELFTSCSVSSQNTASPSAAFNSVLSDLSPTERLMYSLHRSFPGRDLGFIEEMAENIAYHRNVDRLEKFCSAVRTVAKELDYMRCLAEAKQVDRALTSYQTESNFFQTRSTEKTRTSLMKSCLRAAEESHTLTNGEKLVNKLQDLLKEEELGDVAAKANEVQSPEEVKTVISELSKLLREKSDENSRMKFLEIEDAIHLFADTITLNAEKYQHVNQFLESIRKLMIVLMENPTQEVSRIYAIYKKILADFNQTGDKLTPEVSQDIQSMFQEIQIIKHRQPTTAQKEIHDFEMKAKAIINEYL